MTYKELEKINNKLKKCTRARISYNADGEMLLTIKGQPLVKVTLTDILKRMEKSEIYITNLAILREKEIFK